MMRSAIGQSAIEGLRKIRLLEGLSDPELEHVAGLCTWKLHHGNQEIPIVSRDADDTDVYLLVAGRVRVAVYSADGRDRQVTFRDLGAGDCFGELAAIDGAKRSADIYAIEDTLLGRLSATTFMRLVEENAPVRANLLRMLVFTIRDLSDRVFGLSTLGMRNRLNAEILRLARSAGVRGNTARIEDPPTHGEIASRISTYREEVTRGLQAMRKEGLTATDGHALIVLDVERLEHEVAHPTESKERKRSEDRTAPAPRRPPSRSVSAP